MGLELKERGELIERVLALIFDILNSHESVLRGEFEAHEELERTLRRLVEISLDPFRTVKEQEEEIAQCKLQIKQEQQKLEEYRAQGINNHNDAYWTIRRKGKELRELRSTCKNSMNSVSLILNRTNCSKKC